MPKTNPYVAAFVADHHSGGGYPSRGIDDSEFSLYQVLDWVKRQEEVKHLVLLGDSVDKQRNRAAAVMPLVSQLRNAKDTIADLDIGFIQGNHDYDVPPWLAVPGVQWLDQQVIDIHGHWFYCLDFRPRDDIQELLAGGLPDGVTGLLMHQTWSNFMGDVAAPQCGFEDVPEPVRRIVTGDYHGEAILKTYRGKGGQKILVCNPGPTSMQEITEPDEKCFAAMRADGTFELIPLKTRPVLRSDALLNADDMEKFVAEVGQAVDTAVQTAAANHLPEELWRPLLQVTYTHAIPEAKARIEKVIGDKAHLFLKELKPEKVTRTYKANLEAAKGQAFTPLSLLDQEINPANKEAHALAEHLLAATRTKDEVLREVSKWRQQKMEEE